MSDLTAEVREAIAAELREQAAGFEKNASACRNFGVTDFAEGRSNGLATAVERLRARAAELTGTQDQPAEPHQSRVFEPGSPEPLDLDEVMAENGLHFRGVGERKPLRSWCALEEFGGDGKFYSWNRLNSTRESNWLPYTLTEVLPSAEPKEAQ